MASRAFQRATAVIDFSPYATVAALESLDGDIAGSVSAIDARVDALEAEPPPPVTTAGTVHVFNASGTWNKPAGLAYVVVHVYGAGGGFGTGANAAGGSSSFGSHCTANGGGGSLIGSAGGTATGGDINLTGTAGITEPATAGGSRGPFGVPHGATGSAGLAPGGGAGGGGGGAGYCRKTILASALAASEIVTVAGLPVGSVKGGIGLVVVEDYIAS